MPCRAMSIMPLLSEAPMNTPMLASTSMVRNDAALEPTDELRKFTASLATPTSRSNTASTARNSTMHKYIVSIRNINNV